MSDIIFSTSDVVFLISYVESASPFMAKVVSAFSCPNPVFVFRQGIKNAHL